MKNLTIQEAARRLNISEKTLRRWVHIKKIPARLDEGRYWFAERDINAYLQAHQPHIGEESIYEVVYARLDSIDTRLDEIQKAVERLTAHLSTKETPKILKPPQPQYSAKATVQEEQEEKPITSTLPDGLVIATAFAKQHGVPENTANKAIESGRLPVIRGQWKVGRASPTKAWDAEGRSKFYQEYHNSPNFIRCPDCPHSPS
jgi:excisionase family DNA binding protein